MQTSGEADDESQKAGGGEGKHDEQCSTADVVVEVSLVWWKKCGECMREEFLETGRGSLFDCVGAGPSVSTGIEVALALVKAWSGLPF